MDAPCRLQPFRQCVADRAVFLIYPTIGMSYVAAALFDSDPITRVEAETNKRWYITEIPNDSFLDEPLKLGSGDGNYTGGFKYQYLFSASQDRDRREHVHNVGVTVGLEVYTPSNIHLRIDPASPPADERPYAGHFYIGSVYELISREKSHAPCGWGFCLGSDHIFRFEWDFSFLGSYSPAGPAQILIHDAISSDTPQGWNVQISDQFGIDTATRYGWSPLTFAVHDGSPFARLMATARFRYGAVHQDGALGYVAFLTFYGEGGWLQGDRFLSTFEGRPMPTNANPKLAVSYHYGQEQRYVVHDALVEGVVRHDKSTHTTGARQYVGTEEKGWSAAYGNWTFSYTQVTSDRAVAPVVDPPQHRYAVISVVYEKRFRAD